MSDGSTVRLDVRSTLDMLDLVQVVCDQVGRQAGLDEDAVHWVGVAVRESVINAIKHGNSGDPGKRVHLEFALLDSEAPALSIRVRDEGCSFDPSMLPDPLAPENLLKANGRGIFLIRSFVDELTLQRAAEGGMEVVMVKRATPQRV